MIKDSIFEQLDSEKRFHNRNAKCMSLITDRSFNDFYLGLIKENDTTDKMGI